MATAKVCELTLAGGLEQNLALLTRKARSICDGLGGLALGTCTGLCALVIFLKEAACLFTIA